MSELLIDLNIKTVPITPDTTIISGKLHGAASAVPAVLAFKGIPYAAPPVGSLRWQPPQPVLAWTDVREATAFGTTVLSAANPVRVFQEFATLDLISKGRAEMVVGRRS